MGRLAARGPAQGQLHRGPCLGLGGRIGGALVKDHDDIGPQTALDRHGGLRIQKDPGTVHRALELHPGLGDLAHGAQAEHLETAGVGQDRAAPAHEIVQVAMLLDDLRTRAQPQVEGIAEDDLGADLVDVPGQHALDRAVGAHGHEGRCLHGATREMQPPAAGSAIPGQVVETQVTHRGSRQSGRGVRNMASP